MAKRGEPKHLKRIAITKAIPLTDKKKYTWMINTSPGQHSKKFSMPLTVVIRDLLGFAKTAREAKRILNSRLVSVDGVVRTNPAFSVGLFDYISFGRSDKFYEIMIDNKARLIPKEIKKEKTGKKLLKVIRKNTVKKSKITITLHDGKTIMADNNVHVGDSILMNVADKKIEKVLKLEKGSNCLITEGKHAGKIAKLTEIIERKEGKPAEAKLLYNDEEFVTVAKYLFVVNAHLDGEING